MTADRPIAAVRRKIGTAIRVCHEHGFDGVLRILRQKGIPIPQGQLSRWKDGVLPEISFWDSWIKTRGLDWPDDFNHRLDPESPLQPRAAALLANASDAHILDVGAGPISWLGKRVPGKSVRLTAVDPLALHYDSLLKKHGVTPLVRTEPLEAEALTTRFAPDTFDLVFARNCIDHSRDAERAILEMAAVVKPGCHVLLEHRPNVGELEGYHGFHQWNFSTNGDGDFMIGSRTSVVNVTQKYRSRFSTSCELVTDDGMEFLVIRLRKR